MVENIQFAPSNRRLFWLGFALIFLLGATLRLVALGRTVLWIDEITVVGFGGLERTPAQIVSEIFHAEFKGTTGQHMPFQYVLVNLFLHLYHSMGLNAREFLIRLPFTLLGILTLPLLYVTVANVYNRSVGLWTMGLAAISFFHVYQSRDATSYAPLLFFLCLNLYGLVGLLLGREGNKWRKPLQGFVFLIGTAGAIFTHISSLLFLAAEGVLLALGVTWIVLRRTDRKTTNFFAGTSFLLLPLVLLAVSILPFISLISALFGYSGESGVPEESFSIQLILYQMAHFGWGWGGYRLGAFTLAVVLGCVVAIGKPAFRARGLFHIALILIAMALFFFVLKRNCVPRYLAICFFPLLALAGIGLNILTEDLPSRMPGLRRFRLFIVAVVVLCLLAWHVGPYKVLYGMKDKLMPMSRIRDWVLRNVPRGGLVVIQNGYFMRELPGALPLDGRDVAFGDFPNYGVPLETRQWRSQNTRNFFVRFPLAVLVKDAEELNDDVWKWISDDFAKQESVDDETVARLWEWGLSPHGFKITHSPMFTIYQNTETDAVRRAEAMGKIPIWPQGEHWRYVQTQEGHLFVVPIGTSELKVVRSADTSASFNLQLQCVGTRPGRLAAQVSTAGRTGQKISPVSFGQGNSLDLKLGPFMLDAGESVITLSQFPNDGMGLLIYSARLVPIEPHVESPL